MGMYGLKYSLYDPQKMGGVGEREREREREAHIYYN